MGFSKEWNELMDEVIKFKEGLEPVWFRGHGSNADNYLLNSGLFREGVFSNSDRVIGKELSDKEKVDRYINKETVYYNYFKNMGYVHHKENDWDLLFMMQHFKVRTRLLDWSESFAVSLFFALQNWKKGDTARVWMLKPLSLNNLSFNQRIYYDLRDETYEKKLKDRNFFTNSVALYPIRKNHRIVAQQGMFTLQGNSLVSLENEFNGRLIDEGILNYVDLPRNLLKDVNIFLDNAGTNRFTLFPDIEGLAEYLTEKFGNQIFVNREEMNSKSK